MCGSLDSCFRGKVNVHWGTLGSKEVWVWDFGRVPGTATHPLRDPSPGLRTEGRDKGGCRDVRVLIVSCRCSSRPLLQASVPSFPPLRPGSVPTSSLPRGGGDTGTSGDSSIRWSGPLLKVELVPEFGSERRIARHGVKGDVGEP